MQWLALDFKTFLTSARLGSLTLSPQNLEKKVQFQISPEKLENGLSTSKSSPGSILILLQYKKKQPFSPAFFVLFFFEFSPYGPQLILEI